MKASVACTQYLRTRFLSEECIHAAAVGKQFARGNIISERVLEMTIIMVVCTGRSM